MIRILCASSGALVLGATLGCSSPAPAANHATMGTSASTPASAITEMQQGSPALEDNLHSPAAMDLGMDVMGATCNAAAEDVAYCSDRATYVECDNGSWRSIDCGASPQYCGELDGTVGCYSESSNDPEPGQDPVDAAMSNDAGSTPMCPMVAGMYDFVSVTGDGCGAVGGTEITQEGCHLEATGGVFAGVTTFDINASGMSPDCGSSMVCLSFSGTTMTYRNDPCTMTYMRR